MLPLYLGALSESGHTLGKEKVAEVPQLHFDEENEEFHTRLPLISMATVLLSLNWSAKICTASLTGSYVVNCGESNLQNTHTHRH